MPTIDTKIRIGLDTRGIRQGARRGARHVRGFANQTKNILGGLRKSIASSTSIIGGPVGQLAGAAALTLAGKQVIELESQLGGLLLQARKSVDGLDQFKKEVLAVGLVTGQSADDVVSFLDAIVERTGDLDGARKKMLELAKAATGTRTAFGDLGAVSSNLKDKLKIADEDQLAAIDILNVQAKAGAVSFARMAPIIERITAAVSRFDVQGLKGVRIMGALLQVAKKGTGSVESAATAVEGIIAELLDPQKIKKLKRLGFNPIDVVATRKAGRTVTKDLESVIKGVIKATRGDEQKLGQIFGRESIKGITRLAAVFRETGGFPELDDFIQRGGDGTETMNDFNDTLDFTATKLNILRAQFQQALDQNLSGPIDALNAALSILNKHPIIVKGGIAAVLGIGALGVGLKGLDILTRVFKGGKGLAGKVGLPGGGIPVRVTNAGGLGLGGGTAGSQSRARLLRSLGGAGGLAKKAGLVGLAGAAGVGVGTLINDQLVEGTQFGNDIGELLNRMAAFFGSEESKAALAITINAPPGSEVTTAAENTNATVNRGLGF